MTYPKVGIVIVTFNCQEDIVDCLSSLTRSVYPKIKVVVVDNASSDNTVPFIKKHFPNIKIIANKINFGFAKGNNIGINYLLRQEKCQYILVINPDTVSNKQLIKTLITPFFKDNKLGITGPIITYFDDPSKIWYAGGIFNKLFVFTRHKMLDQNVNRLRRDQKKIQTDFITGCCMMIKREVFEKVGYFEESFGSYFEDVDLCLKAQKADFGCFLVTQPLTKHKVSTSTGITGSNRLTPFRAYYYSRNPFLLIKNHQKGWQKITGILGQFMIRLPYYLWQMLKYRDMAAIPIYFKGILAGLIKVF